jgi:hypothetical protein
VRRFRRAAGLLLLLLLPARGFAYRILYAEQYYKLYSLQLYQYPDDTMENIHYLELALKADFVNPLYALARIGDPREWERYRYLFKMHVNLKLVELYLALGSKYDKMAAYFYNAPWKAENLDSLDTAEQCYRVARGYWQEARGWSRRAAGLLAVHLEEIQKWEDESWRIQTGGLDYERIIGDHLARLDEARQAFQSMDETTY